MWCWAVRRILGWSNNFCRGVTRKVFCETLRVCDSTVEIQMSSDSYSSFERKFLAPARQLLRGVFSPFVRLLAALHVSPNAVSFSQVILGFIVVALMRSQPRLAFVLFVAAIALDGIDGALARATNRATKFGALFDQYCDHIREVTVIAGLAWHGALNPFLAGIYGVTYPGFNLTLYLCNANRVPLPIAIKSVLDCLSRIIRFSLVWCQRARSCRRACHCLNGHCHRIGTRATADCNAAI